MLQLLSYALKLEEPMIQGFVRVASYKSIAIIIVVINLSNIKNTSYRYVLTTACH